MARYVDCFIIPVPKKNLKAYKAMAKASAKAWKKAGETIVFGYAIYKSRAHRDSVMKKIHKDMTLMKFWEEDMPFDGMRMIWGGFKSFVASK